MLSSIRTELRLGGGGSGGSHEDEIARRLLEYSTALISQHLGAAAYATTPDAIVNEACVRLCGWLFDVPTAGGASRYANALRSSGAERELLPYVSHSAGLPDAT